MQKLRRILSEIKEELYFEFEKTLNDGNASKFYTLLKAYKDSVLSDDEIREQVKCTENSFYVLKSRLFDKVQKFLLEKSILTPVSGEVRATDDLDSYIYEYPTETAIALLEELEKKFMGKDSPMDLINVYSSLKKAHFYSDKFYTYSQLFNNQVAYALALEKAEEILYHFNRTLAEYYFSNSENELDMMKLLVKEIKNIQSLYKSPRIEIVHQLMIIQMALFARIEQDGEQPIEDLLMKCEKILGNYKQDKKVYFFIDVINFLKFEYYFSINQWKKAQIYFDELENISQKWLLQNNSCMAFKFLFSKIEFLAEQNRREKIGMDADFMHYDRRDLHTSVAQKYYSGLSLYYKGNIKKSISVLNEILNDVSFKNYFFVETEIKLSLAFLYIQQNEFDIADNIIKGVNRKLSGLKSSSFKNIKQALKLLGILNSGIKSASAKAKYIEALEQFHFYNHKEKKILGGLHKELEHLVLPNRR